MTSVTLVQDAGSQIVPTDDYLPGIADAYARVANEHLAVVAAGNVAAFIKWQLLMPLFDQRTRTLSNPSIPPACAPLEAILAVWSARTENKRRATARVPGSFVCRGR